MVDDPKLPTGPSEAREQLIRNRGPERVPSDVRRAVIADERQPGPLTLDQYFGSIVSISREPRENATALLTRVNRLLSHFGQYRRIVCGFVPSEEENARRANASVRSKHLQAQAVDLADPDGDLDQFCMDNQPLLERCCLWLEHPAMTKGHCHLQSVPPLTGRRVFYG